MTDLARWTSSSGKKFMVTVRPVEGGCISWTARTPWGDEITSGVTDDVSRRIWVEEVKEAVDLALAAQENER